MKSYISRHEALPDIAPLADPVAMACTVGRDEWQVSHPMGLSAFVARAVWATAPVKAIVVCAHAGDRSALEPVVDFDVVGWMLNFVG